jgi:hypothetical protein
MAVEAKEAKGQGTASATILNRVMETEGGTRVVAETDLAVTGRQAQFGRGIMQDVASSMLRDFSRCLSTLMTASGSSEAAGEAAPEPQQALAVGGHVRKALFGRIRAIFGRVFGRS